MRWARTGDAHLGEGSMPRCRCDRVAVVCAGRRDRGAVSLFDLLTGAMVATILSGALAMLLWSSQQATLTAERRAVVTAELADLTGLVRAMLGGAGAATGCLDRLDPQSPASSSNCRRLTVGQAVLVEGGPDRVCALVRAATGIEGRGSPGQLEEVLVAPGSMCVELTGSGPLLAVRTPAGPGSDVVAPVPADDPVANLTVVSGVVVGPDEGPLFRYFDVVGGELEPVEGAGLVESQLAEVRTVRMEATIESGRAVVPFVATFGVGAGTFAQEQRWQGR